MSWNYRVVRVTPENDKGGTWYEVREIYYDDDGQPNGYTDGESGPCGDSLDDLRGDLDLIRQALDRPVLNLEDLATSLPGKAQLEIPDSPSVSPVLDEDRV